MWGGNSLDARYYTVSVTGYTGYTNFVITDANGVELYNQTQAIEGTAVVVDGVLTVTYHLKSDYKWRITVDGYTMYADYRGASYISSNGYAIDYNKTATMSIAVIKE